MTVRVADHDSRSRRVRAYSVKKNIKIFKNVLTNEFSCDIIRNISCEEDTQRIANVSREPTVGVSR